MYFLLITTYSIKFTGHSLAILKTVYYNAIQYHLNRDKWCCKTLNFFKFPLLKITKCYIAQF
jgi:hypothetical protein